MWPQMPDITGAQALAQLKSLGVDIQAVTTRPERCRAATELFLERFYPGLITRAP